MRGKICVMPQDCPQYHQSYKIKATVNWFILQDSVLIQGLNDNKRQIMSGTEVLVWKGTQCQKVSGTGSYELYFKVMVIKHAAQPTMRQQENSVFPQCLSEGRYNKNRNLVNIVWILPSVQIHRQNKNVNFMQHHY